MPVLPALYAIGTFASVGVQAYGMAQSRKASKESAALASATAEFNTQIEEQSARQAEMDAAAATTEARREAAIYLSRQKAAYAANNVLISGSPLAVMATTAGRLEQRILQERQNALRTAAQHRAAGAMGLRYGAAEASAIRTQGRMDQLRGGVGILSTLRGAYESGVFNRIAPVPTG